MEKIENKAEDIYEENKKHINTVNTCSGTRNVKAKSKVQNVQASLQNVIERNICIKRTHTEEECCRDKCSNYIYMVNSGYLITGFNDHFIGLEHNC